jgi:secreted PhoX family phosphatase
MKKSLIPLLLLMVSFATLFSYGGNATSSPTIKGISFETLSIPQTDEEKLSVRVSPKAYVTYSDGTTKEFPLSYKTLFWTGDKDTQGGTIGLLYDKDGNSLERVSTQPDANSVFVRGGKYYLLTHFEDSPGAIYLTEMQKGADGTFKALKFRNIDLSSVGGTFINCAGSKTPWDTHLASEEDYYLDSYWFDPNTKKYTAQHIEYCKKDASGHLTGGYSPPSFAPTANYAWWCSIVKGIRDDYLKDPSLFTPYNYGYNIEVGVDNNGNPYIVNNLKHYVFGKYTPEMAVVMPDNKTVYLTDDGSYVGLYMFVADKEKDLSVGTLYMAKWVQVSADNGGRAKLEWIKLGSGKDSEIKAIIDKRPNLSDIFDVQDPANCPQDQGYKLVYPYAGKMCLRLRDGTNGSTISSKFTNADEVKKAAAFLESRKYGAYLGATSEFNKEEGIVYNPDKNVLYVAMSYVERSMEDNSSDPANDIKLPPNKCGIVYQVKLGTASGINSSYVGTEMEGLIAGKPLKEGEQYADQNACHPDYIANPDNLRYFKGILFIGEDSAYHFNNMSWAYDTNTGKLTRILTVPTGAENTGTFAIFQTDNNLYIFTNAQHPLEDKFKNARGEYVNTGFIDAATEEQKRGYVGYIFGLPPIK